MPLLPALTFMVIVTQIPFLLTVWYSLQSWNLLHPGTKHYVGFRNYKTIFSDHIFRTAVVNTVVFTVAPVILAIVYFLKPFGVHKVDWINSHSQMTIITVLTWQWTPFMVLIVLAGLQSQSQDILEAARVDGADGLRIFRSMTLPHLRPYLELGVLLGSIYIVQAFDAIFMITSGGPGQKTTNLPFYLYEVAFRGFDIGRASAMGVVVVIATIIVATLALRLISSLFSEEGMAGR